MAEPKKFYIFRRSDLAFFPSFGFTVSISLLPPFRNTIRHLLRVRKQDLSHRFDEKYHIDNPYKYGIL